MTRIFGITIVTTVGLAACGQTNMDHKIMNRRGEENRAEGNENESGGNCTERNESRCIK